MPLHPISWPYGGLPVELETAKVRPQWQATGRIASEVDLYFLPLGEFLAPAFHACNVSHVDKFISRDDPSLIPSMALQIDQLINCKRRT